MPEFVRSVCPAERPRVAVLDFDGTLSLIRSGWLEIMVELMRLELLPLPGTTEPESDLVAHITDFVLNLNGRPTIYQMDCLVHEVHQRGGQPKTAAEYTQQFLDALLQTANRRIDDLQTGRLTTDDLLVPGARSMLDDLVSRGIRLTLASGTAQAHVRHEAALLRIDHYFEGRMYGPGDDPRLFSKLAVMRQTLEQTGAKGAHLLGFGDGFTEIENTRQLGGIAIGCATDESGRSGRIEEWKRTKLIQAGADVIVADYQNWPVLAQTLFAA